jgi:hypothetical protein
LTIDQFFKRDLSEPLISEGNGELARIIQNNVQLKKTNSTLKIALLLFTDYWSLSRKISYQRKKIPLFRDSKQAQKGQTVKQKFATG